VTGVVLTEMSMLIVDVDILGVQGWWLPWSGITKLKQLRISSAQTVRRVESGEWRLFVCLLYYYWLLRDMCDLRCLQMGGLTC
jgi:hypothetical protein